MVQKKSPKIFFSQKLSKINQKFNSTGIAKDWSMDFKTANWRIKRRFILQSERANNY